MHMTCFIYFLHRLSGFSCICMAINLAIVLAFGLYLQARSSKTSCTRFSGAFRICSFCIYPQGERLLPRQPEHLIPVIRLQVGAHGAQNLKAIPVTDGESHRIFSAFTIWPLRR
nr:MAG TPA: hypothetical protein [Caudoviricetes sp.]